LNVTDEKQKVDDVSTAGWSIYEDDITQDYNMALYTFAVAEKEGPKEAGKFLEEYIYNHGGSPLTDFDEVTSRITATFPITNVSKGDIDQAKLRKLQQKIGRIILTS
jgi:hypothetical protein